MAEPSKTQQFLDAYRAAFEALDVEAIADLFSYPCQITSDAGEVTVTTVGTREAWVPQIERLVSAYREIGVHSAAVLELHVTELTSRLAQVTVRWALADGKGRSIYDFEASYSLEDHGNGMRITGITHNENVSSASGHSRYAARLTAASFRRRLVRSPTDPLARPPLLAAGSPR